MVVIIATLRAKNGKENELASSMEALAIKVKENEPETMEYIFHRSMKDPALFMVYEQYSSGEAVRTHMASPHFQEATKKFPELLDGPMDVQMFNVLF